MRLKQLRPFQAKTWILKFNKTNKNKIQFKKKNQLKKITVEITKKKQKKVFK